MVQRGSFRGVRQRLLGVLSLLTAGSMLSGCFFYDSRWGQAKASQKRVAAERMPSQLRSDHDSGKLKRPVDSRASVAQLRIRAYATPHYQSALVNGQASFQQALDDANPTLAHDLSFRLELSEYRVWSAAVSDDDLSALLTAIEKEDSADDVDWVVVLASPRHTVAAGPDELGVGQYLSRYLAIRAMSDAAEYDAIHQSFDELSDDEKRRLYAARKRHKSAGVLLHEIGHTLGIPHELDKRSLMNAQYDPHASAFGSSSVRLAQRVLDLRHSAPGTELSRNAARAALNVLAAAPAHTYEASSASVVERLLQSRARAAVASVPVPLLPRAGATRAQTSPAPAARLPEPDRALLAQAQQSQRDGKFVEARAQASALFERYPDDMAVQDLRCQLAMKVGLSMAEERVECAPLRRLSGLR